MRPQVSATAAPATSGTAGRSRRPAGPRDSGSLTTDSAAAASPTGTLIQKIQCQSRPWTTTPPTSGPPATARPAIAPMMPITEPRLAGGKALVAMVRLSGVTAAAPTPCTARAAISAAAVGASAQAAEATVNNSRPATYIRRRPSRSPRAAAVTMPAANVRPYEFTDHSSVPRLPPRLRWMAGSAVTTTRASSATMKKATAVSTRISAGDRRPAAPGRPVVPMVCSISAPVKRAGRPGRRSGVHHADAGRAGKWAVPGQRVPAGVCGTMAR